MEIGTPDAALKRAIAAAYEQEKCAEEDHLIPLCAGGTNSVKNLWCQQTNVKKKDWVEAAICRAIKSGKLSIEAARAVVLDPKNWR